MSATITVVSTRTIGDSGKLGEVTYQVDGQPGKAKYWTGDFKFGEGESLAVEFEKKNSTYDPSGFEIWIKSPPKNGGGGFKGGGGGKADPASLAIQRDKLALDAQKNEDIKNICDMKDVSIISQVIFKAAIETAIHETKPGTAVSPDAVDVNAQNYVQIFHKIRAGVGGGNQT